MFQVKDNSLGNIKYVGISRAVVVDNNDPLKRGRIRVSSPVLGETNWIPYLTAPGMFSVPDLKTVVYLQCDGGFHTHPVAWGNLNYGDDDDLQFPEEFQRVSPTNRGIYTPGGHLLEIDDGSDPIGTDKGFRFTGSGGTLFHIKEEPTDNSVTFEVNGPVLKIDGTADAITASVAFGDNWELSAANGFQVATPAAGGTSLSMKGGKVDITGTLDCTFTSSSASLTFESGTDTTIISDGGSITGVASAGDIEFEAAGGAKLKLSAGKAAIGIPGSELFDLVDQTLDAFINNAPTIVNTAVGPGVLSPAVVTLLTNIKTLLTLVKGSL